MGYSYNAKDNEAKALGRSLPISMKHAVSVCDAIRGKKLSVAKLLLDRVSAMRQAVPYRRYNQEMAHNKNVGSGRFPVNTCVFIKSVVESAEANAQLKGLSTAALVIKHIACHKAGKIQRHGRQRTERKNAHLEVVLAEGSA
jgi:large subunit ribosomal protein L22